MNGWHRTTLNGRSASRRFILIGLAVAISISVSVISISSYTDFGLRGVVHSVRNNFLFCPDEAKSIERWIQPPANLFHRMNDRELFWMASLVPAIKDYPFNRTRKIAFMFLTLGPLPLAPLWERFFEGHEKWYSIYIHSIPSYLPKFHSSSVFYRRNIPSQITEWGRISLVDGERRLLANAMLDVSNERFVLVSESCIPLYNFSFIYTYIMNSRTSFVDSFDDPGKFGRQRYSYNMAPQVNVTEWRKGNQWFEVDRRLAVTLIGDTKFYPLFKEYCHPACYVDEHYFPTVLTIKAPQQIANRSITWVDWSRGGAHPATYGTKDITADLFSRIKASRRLCNYNGNVTTVCFLFARKFSPSTLKPLLKISSAVLGF